MAMMATGHVMLPDESIADLNTHPSLELHLSIGNPLRILQSPLDQSREKVIPIYFWPFRHLPSRHPQHPLSVVLHPYDYNHNCECDRE